MPVLSLADITPAALDTQHPELNLLSAYPLENTATIPIHQSVGIDEDLRRLTSILAAITNTPPAGGLLGGEYGYGCAYENNTFGMHPFCWCDSPTCGWCQECTCTYGYRINNAEVSAATFDTYLDTWYANNQHASRQVLPPHCSEYRTSTCLWCRNTDSDGQLLRAPHFWHKPSGTTVRWYKYIGRGMTTTLPDTWTWPQVYRTTIESIQPVSGTNQPGPWLPHITEPLPHP